MPEGATIGVEVYRSNSRVVVIRRFISFRLGVINQVTGVGVVMDKGYQSKLVSGGQGNFSVKWLLVYGSC